MKDPEDVELTTAVLWPTLVSGQDGDVRTPRGANGPLRSVTRTSVTRGRLRRHERSSLLPAQERWLVVPAQLVLRLVGGDMGRIHHPIRTIAVDRIVRVSTE